MYGVALLLHVLGATVWTGGHLILATTILPRALRERDPTALMRFESGYERIGIPALLVQVVTGVWLAHGQLPSWSRWLDLGDPVARLILLKLGLLTLTAALALDARFRVIPNMSPDRLADLAWHIVPVTLLSVLFVFVGVSFRTGWLY